MEIVASKRTECSRLPQTSDSRLCLLKIKNEHTRIVYNNYNRTPLTRAASLFELKPIPLEEFSQRIYYRLTRNPANDANRFSVPHAAQSKTILKAVFFFAPSSVTNTTAFLACVPGARKGRGIREIGRARERECTYAREDRVMTPRTAGLNPYRAPSC